MMLDDVFDREIEAALEILRRGEYEEKWRLRVPPAWLEQAHKRAVRGIRKHPYLRGWIATLYKSKRWYWLLVEAPGLADHVLLYKISPKVLKRFLRVHDQKTYDSHTIGREPEDDIGSPAFDQSISESHLVGRMRRTISYASGIRPKHGSSTVCSVCSETGVSQGKSMCTK